MSVLMRALVARLGLDGHRLREKAKARLCLGSGMEANGAGLARAAEKAEPENVDTIIASIRDSLRQLA